jgi:hypothetical protein
MNEWTSEWVATELNTVFVGHVSMKKSCVLFVQGDAILDRMNHNAVVSIFLVDNNVVVVNRALMM